MMQQEGFLLFHMDSQRDNQENCIDGDIAYCHSPLREIIKLYSKL